MTSNYSPSLPLLLVDGDPENRLFWKQEISKFGYVVLEADNCEEAIEVLKTQRVCGIIFDIELSRNERTNMFATLQSMGNNMPVVIVLASTSSMMREEAYDLGASAMLSKPLAPSTLITRLSELLIPSTVRWRGHKATGASSQVHTLSMSVDTLALGRGGMSLRKSGNLEMLEGDRVEFDLNVQNNGSFSGILRGTGIIRYVALDARNRGQKVWGIEFETLDDESLSAVTHTISAREPLAYIPSA